MTASLVLKYANRLAQISNYKGLINPIQDWKRPYYKVAIGNYELTKIGVVTAGESAVIQALRSKVALAIRAAQTNIFEIFYVISEALGVENIENLQQLLGDPERLDAVLKEKGIEREVAENWLLVLNELRDTTDIDGIRGDVYHHIVTFVMCMRCNPEWDYADTEQMTTEEMDAVLQFLNDEEDKLEAPSAENKGLTVKKL
jgi:hypothetical protein